MYKANDPARKKAERERRKYLEPKEYEVLKKKEPACVRKYRFFKKDVRAIKDQHCKSTSETTPTTSSAS